jgi:hypothetical protein
MGLALLGDEARRAEQAERWGLIWHVCVDDANS